MDESADSQPFPAYPFGVAAVVFLLLAFLPPLDLGGRILAFSFAFVAEAILSVVAFLAILFIRSRDASTEPAPATRPLNPEPIDRTSELEEKGDRRDPSEEIDKLIAELKDMSVEVP